MRRGHRLCSFSSLVFRSCSRKPPRRLRCTVGRLKTRDESAARTRLHNLPGGVLVGKRREAV